LRLLSGITIIETMPKSSGEEELIEVVRQNKCDLTVSDDLRAIPKFNTVNSSIIFSSHLLYYLYRAGIISKEKGLVFLLIPARTGFIKLMKFLSIMGEFSIWQAMRLERKPIICSPLS